MRGDPPAGMKQVAVELFSGLAGSYDRTLDLATLLQDRRWKNWVAQRTGNGEGRLLLDVGSGTLVLEERLRGGWKVVGVDLTGKMLRLGKEKKLGNVELLINGDAEALPFRERAFDGVTTCYVAKYVSLPRFAGELARVVKPGGTVAAYDFVKPRGPAVPFLALYVHGFIRFVGFLLGLTRKESAFTFRNLPAIVEGASWDGEMTKVMEANGFETREFERLSGGVVTAYLGIRGP